jgi:serine/threonine-protein kinase
VFAVFDERTQDSGNISYGVLVGDRRFFVKTAGMPENSKDHLSHEQRVALLRNAVSFRRSVNHHSLPELLTVIESPHGPMLVYERVTGELRWSRFDGHQCGLENKRHDHEKEIFQIISPAGQDGPTQI